MRSAGRAGGGGGAGQDRQVREARKLCHCPFERFAGLFLVCFLSVPACTCCVRVVTMIVGCLFRDRKMAAADWAHSRGVAWRLFFDSCTTASDSPPFPLR